MGAYKNHVLPLGSLSPADPLHGTGTLTSALIINRTVEVRDRKLQFYRVMATIFTKI